MYTYNFPLTFVVVVAFFYVVVFLSFDFVWYKCRLVLCKKIDFEEETISLKQIKSKSNKEIINGQCHWLMGLVITLHRPYERTVTYIFRSFRSLWVENSSSLARYRNPV